MKSISIFILMAMFAFAISSCKKDKDETPTPDPGPVTTVKTHISGTVLDTWGSPIYGVTVTCGTQTTTTDNYGTFAFLNFTASVEKMVLKFEKADYFTAVRTEVPRSGEYVETEVTMIPYSWGDATQSSFHSSIASTVYVASTGSEIDFPADKWVIKGTTTPYSGYVYVKAAYLNPTNSNYGKYAMGGFMKGIDSLNNEVMLMPYGGLHVEIFGDSGQKLDLDAANGGKATVRLQIPTDLQPIAPANIDLWNFNMAYGVAGAGGSAAKQGDKYVTQVQHFSYWSCEAVCPGKPATINGKVVDDAGTPVSGVPVIVGSSVVFTKVDGTFSKVVPAGIVIPVMIKNGYLGTTNTATMVGPLTNEQNYQMLSNLTIPSISYLNGRLVNCTGGGVKGRVLFNSQGYTTGAPTDANGYFKIPITTFMMYGNITAHGNGMIEEHYVSNISSYPFTMTNPITLCPPLPTGPNVLIAFGTTYNDFDLKEGQVYNSMYTSIYASNTATGNYFSLSFMGTTAGTYNIDGSSNSGYVNVNGNEYHLASGTINITQFGAVNQIIQGTFSGTDSTGNQFSGQFSVIRQDQTK